MKLGFFSDVHANLEALTAVLDDARSEKIDKLFFLGDAVGYGPDPNECLEVISKIAEICLMGNHDYAALGLLDTTCFNSHAREAIVYTQRVLTPENKKRLNDFKLEHCYTDFHLVHATPEHPNQWEYITTLEDAEHNFPHLKKRICLIGHSHYPAVISTENGCSPVLLRKESMELFEERRFIINIGSVGQPRDNNPDSCYLVYDTKSRLALLKRVKYDIETTQRKMIEAQLPEHLVKRLERGK